MYRIPSPKKAEVTCHHCDTTHTDVPVEYDEDGGYADLDTEHCNADNCTVELCSSCPQFTCDACGDKFCLEHVTKRDDLELCPACVAELPEPECECVRTGDLDDARDCQLHGPSSEMARRQRQQEVDDNFAYYAHFQGFFRGRP